jgi:acyl carrier protein
VDIAVNVNAWIVKHRETSTWSRADARGRSQSRDITSQRRQRLTDHGECPPSARLTITTSIYETGIDLHTRARHAALVTDQDVRQKLREYIVQTARLPTIPGDDERLIDKGFIASVRLLDLIGFLEDTFSIRLRPKDVVPENLGTIAQIAQVVHGRIMSTR